MNWRNRIGERYRCVHTGRIGVLIETRWQNRTHTGGDWGVYLDLKADDGAEFTCRPAFVERTEGDTPLGTLHP